MINPFDIGLRRGQKTRPPQAIERTYSTEMDDEQVSIDEKRSLSFPDDVATISDDFIESGVRTASIDVSNGMNGTAMLKAQYPAPILPRAANSQGTQTPPNQRPLPSNRPASAETLQRELLSVRMQMVSPHSRAADLADRQSDQESPPLYVHSVSGHEGHEGASKSLSNGAETSPVCAQL